MRIEINLPDNKDFLRKLQSLADEQNRSRKNYLETIVIAHVESSRVVQKPKAAQSK